MDVKITRKRQKIDTLSLIEVLETNFNVVCLALLVASLAKAEVSQTMNEMAAQGAAS